MVAVLQNKGWIEHASFRLGFETDMAALPVCFFQGIVYGYCGAICPGDGNVRRWEWEGLDLSSPPSRICFWVPHSMFHLLKPRDAPHHHLLMLWLVLVRLLTSSLGLNFVILTFSSLPILVGFEIEHLISWFCLDLLLHV